MRPYLSFFRDDLEDTPVGAPPRRWASASNGVAVVEYRGSRWVALPGGCAPLIVAGPASFDRLEFDLELPSNPPASLTFVLQVQPRFGVQIEAGGSAGYRIRLSSEWCAAPGPLEGPHHLEIRRTEDGQTCHYWDGDLMLTLPTERAVGSLRAICNASAGQVLLDNIVCSREEPGGVALGHDGQVLTLCGGLGCRASLAPPLFGAPEASSVLRRPSCASLPSGWRMVAAESGSGIAVYSSRRLLQPCLEGGATMLTGHRCPALCLRPERGEALLLTWHEGSLHLTRGTVGPATATWQPPDPAPVVSGTAAEASPAICALPDGSLLLAYQDTRSEVHILTSSDDGQTWLPSPE